MSWFMEEVSTMEDNIKILILEDEPADAELSERELRSSGLNFVAEKVDTEAKFLAALNTFTPDLILSDYNLPGYDGVTALRSAMEVCPDVPVIFVSGTIGEERAIEIIKSGATDYVLKNNLARLAPSVTRALKEARHLREKILAEEQLRANEKRLEALLQLSQMHNKAERELADVALEQAVALTHSEVGYLHFYDEATMDLSLFAWSKRTLEMCEAAKDPHYPLEKAGVWADCVRQKQPVIHNDFPSLADKKGYPEGHFPIKRHMSVPLLDGEQVVAVIGVGNKAAPYNESDVRMLSLFGDNMWKLVREQKIRNKLRESEEQTRLLLNSTVEAIYGIDMDGKCTFANSSCLDMLGYADINELLGKNMHTLTHHTREDGTDYPEDECLIFHAFRESQETHVDCEVLWRADGTSFPVEYWSRPITADGETIGAVVTFVDISERRQTEIELQRHREQLEEMVEERTRELQKSEEILRNNMEELKQFNRFVVDREQKMIELKKEINDLLEQQGTEARYRIVS